jgi:hypothetical protein
LPLAGIECDHGTGDGRIDARITQKRFQNGLRPVDLRLQILDAGGGHAQFGFGCFDVFQGRGFLGGQAALPFGLLSGQIAQGFLLGQLRAQAGELGAVGSDESLLLPQGQKLAWQRYGSGHVHGVLFDSEEVMGFERDALHREVSRSAGRLEGRRAYDALGRLSWQKLSKQLKQFDGRSLHSLRPAVPEVPDPAPLIERDYRYRKAGEVERITDNHRGQIRYAYDWDGRLLKRYRDSSALGYQGGTLCVGRSGQSPSDL